MNLFKKTKKNQEENQDKKKDALQSKENALEMEVDKNVAIYAMPERFRVVHKQKSRAKAMGMLIIIGGVIFLIAISVLLYFYLIKEKPAATKPAITADSEDEIKKETVKDELKKESAQKQVEIKSPKKSYTEAKAEFDRVITFNDFERLTLKYGSKNKIKEFEKEKKQVEGLPESFKNNIVSLVIQQAMPKLSEIGNIKADIKGDTATLSVATKDLSKKGVIIMEQEDDVWKLGSESWDNAKEESAIIEINPIEPVEFNVGSDSDGDGLTDKEENIFGSDANNSDGDGDGYTDLSEIMNLYNPAGGGKLEDSSAVKKYMNAAYGYNLIYPSGWQASNVGGDDSVIFKSSDNHFVQVISQTNTNKQSIDEWYKQQFNVSDINNLKRVAGNNWQGIKNDDGLTVYLTDDEKIYIYTITYNFGGQNILEYKNIFEMMIKSFRIEG